jgi:putative transposase
MPRGPRLDVEGALQHVMARGIERRDLFRTDLDRKDLLLRLEKLVAETGAAVYAWSLMPNHFHLLIRSGPMGLSAFMRRLQTGYAVAFNRRHKRSGHLFQNRYKSILVQKDEYLLELVRYIHLNPLRAGLLRSMRSLDAYRWSGHAVLIGRRQAAWQDTEQVLDLFGRKRNVAVRAYREFIAEGVPMGRRPELTGDAINRRASDARPGEVLDAASERRQVDQRVLGSEQFVAEIQQKTESRLVYRLGPEQIEPALMDLLEKLCDKEGIRRTDIRGPSRERGVSQVRRELAYQAVRELSVPLVEVASFLHVTPPAVSQMIIRAGERTIISGEKSDAEAKKKS